MAYELELKEATAATERAAAELAKIDRMSLRPRAERLLLKRIRSRLPNPAGTKWYERSPSVADLYESARYVLGKLDELERIVSPEQKHVLSEARRELHDVEDLLEAPFWRG